MDTKRVLFWAKAVGGLGMLSLILGTIGSIVLAFQTDCIDEGFFGCNSYEYPYVAPAIGLAFGNLIISSTVVLIAVYIEWSVAHKLSSTSSSL